MAGRGSKGDQRTRTEAERARLYSARAHWHTRQLRRRVRDNVIACVAGALLLGGIVVSQVAHAQATAPEPAPTQTTTPQPSSEPSATPTPADSPSETPAP